MRATRNALAGLVVVVLVGVFPAAPAHAGDGGLPDRCGAATKANTSSRAPGGVPVLFVHGFGGGPGNFHQRRDDRASMLDEVASVDGVTAYTFDYSDHALAWVTKPAIGPALARSIDCLARASGRKVVVVAHSMGGLATRFAQGQVIHGRPVSDSLARVVTIGTPTEGVLLLSFTNGTVSNAIVQAAVDAAGEVCSDQPKEKRRRLCQLLDEADAPAVTAMAPHAAALDDLPPWGAGVVVHPIAADLELRLSVFGIGTTVSLGDIVVTVDSATADPSPGERPLVVRCRANLTDLVTVVDQSPCSHANEVANRRIVRAVRRQVRLATEQAAKSAEQVTLERDIPTTAPRAQVENRSVSE
jgi:pimeloyl-ACP methyl ester carboxylesterase